MAEHEPCIGRSDEWYTPPEMLEAIGLRYKLDPCSPGQFHWVPADLVYTKDDDGLKQPWPKGESVFMNPPFGGRNGQVPWLKKFLDHGNGIAVVAARTSSGWFHDLAVRAESMLFPRGKTKFVRPDGSRGKSPGTGIVLLGIGEECNRALSKSGLGLWLPTPQRDRG